MQHGALYLVKMLHVVAYQKSPNHLFDAYPESVNLQPWNGHQETVRRQHVVAYQGSEMRLAENACQVKVKQAENVCLEFLEKPHVCV